MQGVGSRPAPDGRQQAFNLVGADAYIAAPHTHSADLGGSDGAANGIGVDADSLGGLSNCEHVHAINVGICWGLRPTK